MDCSPKSGCRNFWLHLWKSQPKGPGISKNPKIPINLLCYMRNIIFLPYLPMHNGTREKWILYWSFSRLCFTRVFHSPYDWWNSVRGWQIDEDCHKFGIGKKRREGVIVALRNFGIAIGSTISVIIISVVLVGNDQSVILVWLQNICHKHVDFIWYTYLVGLPLMKLVVFGIVFSIQLRVRD